MYNGRDAWRLCRFSWNRWRSWTTSWCLIYFNAQIKFLTEAEKRILQNNILSKRIGSKSLGIRNKLGWAYHLEEDSGYDPTSSQFLSWPEVLQLKQTCMVENCPDPEMLKVNDMTYYRSSCWDHMSNNIESNNTAETTHKYKISLNSLSTGNNQIGRKRVIIVIPSTPSNHIQTAALILFFMPTKWR